MAKERNLRNLGGTGRGEIEFADMFSVDNALQIMRKEKKNFLGCMKWL